MTLTILLYNFGACDFSLGSPMVWMFHFSGCLYLGGGLWSLLLFLILGENSLALQEHGFNPASAIHLWRASYFACLLIK